MSYLNYDMIKMRKATEQEVLFRRRVKTAPAALFLLRLQNARFRPGVRRMGGGVPQNEHPCTTQTSLLVFSLGG